MNDVLHESIQCGVCDVCSSPFAGIRCDIVGTLLVSKLACDLSSKRTIEKNSRVYKHYGILVSPNPTIVWVNESYKVFKF